MPCTDTSRRTILPPLFLREGLQEELLQAVVARSEGARARQVAGVVRRSRVRGGVSETVSDTVTELAAERFA